MSSPMRNSQTFCGQRRGEITETLSPLLSVFPTAVPNPTFRHWLSTSCVLYLPLPSTYRPIQPARVHISSSVLLPTSPGPPVLAPSPFSDLLFNLLAYF